MYLDFYIMISFQYSFVLHSYLMVLLRLSINKLLSSSVLLGRKELFT